MYRGNALAEAIKSLGARGMRNISICSTGIITSVDTTKYLAKVMLGINGIETGWIPIGSILAGNGYGVIAMPEPGTEVTVIFDEGNIQTGKIVLCNFNETDMPPQGLNPGEILIRGQSGAKVKLDNNGHISLNGGTRAVAGIGDRVDMDSNSPTYGQIISGNPSVTI